jgi:hypothetical protein
MALNAFHDHAVLLIADDENCQHEEERSSEQARQQGPARSLHQQVRLPASNKQSQHIRNKQQHVLKVRISGFGPVEPYCIALRVGNFASDAGRCPCSFYFTCRLKGFKACNRGCPTGLTYHLN